MFLNNLFLAEKCGPKTCFNLTLAAGASKTSNDRVINIKITDGAAYNVNVYRKSNQS